MEQDSARSEREAARLLHSVVQIAWVGSIDKKRDQREGMTLPSPTRYTGADRKESPGTKGQVANEGDREMSGVEAKVR